MVDADGFQRGCAGFQLDRAGAVRVARFVCSDSSGSPQVVAPPDRMPRPYRAVRRTRRDVWHGISAPMGQWSAAGGIQPGPVTEGRGAVVPQKPKAARIISLRRGLWRQKVAGSTAGSYWSTQSLWTRPS